MLESFCLLNYRKKCLQIFQRPRVFWKYLFFQRTWHNKKLSKFSKLQFWLIIFTKKSFGTWQFGKIGILVNFSIPKLKFCKVAQLFIVSVVVFRHILHQSIPLDWVKILWRTLTRSETFFHSFILSYISCQSAVQVRYFCSFDLCRDSQINLT